MVWPWGGAEDMARRMRDSQDHVKTMSVAVPVLYVLWITCPWLHPVLRSASSVHVRLLNATLRREKNRVRNDKTEMCTFKSPLKQKWKLNHRVFWWVCFNNNKKNPLPLHPEEPRNCSSPSLLPAIQFYNSFSRARLILLNRPSPQKQLWEA